MRIEIKGAAGFLTIFMVNALIWWYFRSYINFLFAVVIFLSAALSVFITWHYRDRFGISLELPKNNVSKNGKIKLKISVYSMMRIFFFPVRIKYSVTNEFTGSMVRQEVYILAYPFKKESMSFELGAYYYGMINVKIEEFAVGDFFNLASVKTFVPKEMQTFVYPEYDNLNEEPLHDVISGFPHNEAAVKKGNDYNADYEIREYVMGDELKNIHWKLTAKQDRLMVRDRRSSGKNKVNILLVLGNDADENDSLIYSLNAICNELVSKEYPIELFYWGYSENVMKSSSISEISDIENIICEILGINALSGTSLVKQYYEMKNTGIPYVLVTTGVKKGEYVR